MALLVFVSFLATRCQGNVKIREKRVTDDRISFSGDLEISVLYRAKNGERPLYAMQASLPLEDFLHIDGLEKDMETSLDVVPEHLDCQIINDRKIGVKAVLGVTATGILKRNGFSRLQVSCSFAVS